ncbi:TnsD family Tn7-like transposition protein [Lysinibacillus sp. 1 U-2021]|uniref:TnsD family Tn7-like transposition protein n=1 Tax=Lysinibacillus TaxID=400634 RepID=UPI0022B99827|nr:MULTISPECIES: TnsD family Tn7-like transposition protein [unclassified Lysinibacillus]WBF58245.1 TniQ family protein [Lysinibacillus sp. JK80]WGT40403.1 TnsD family Tn7-like transposition protein [Lysinibacillus sp. 1 U-2021]
MIGWFPYPYEDELLYSLFARYSNRSTELSLRHTLNKLFNDSRSKLTPDFPSNLETVMGHLRFFGYLDFESILFKHTPFYYFTNFLINSDKKLIIEAVKLKKSNNIQMILGQIQSKVKETKYFKYCPSCLKNDIQEFGEAYWRISHQLPSVFICLQHNESLHFSSVLYRNKNSQLVTPNKNNCFASINTKCIQNNVTFAETNHLIDIANNSKRLLMKDIHVKSLNLVSLYKDKLRKKGLITAGGHVRQTDLYNEFIKFYGMNILGYFQSVPILDQESCWLKTITRKHRISFHPVRHLLLMNFLEIEINTIETDYFESPFGKGPFPCLNPAAEHYKDFVVDNLSIKRCTDTGRPIGIFNCNCEFKYTRLGPDTSQEGMYEYRFVRNFGSVWESKLFQYIDNEHLSFRKAAKLLKVDVGTAIKYYKKNKNKVVAVKNSTNILDYRCSWLRTQKENPTYSKTQIRKLIPNIYSWLYRHDKAWLYYNSPASIKSTKIVSRVNWHERDLEIQEMVKGYLLTIDIDTKPVRLTKRHIGIAIEKLALIEKQLEKMPLTKELIESVTESNEQYRERLKMWRIKCL